MKDTWMRQGDKKGRTALHHAAIYGYMNLITYIVTEVIESFEDLDLRNELLNIPDYKGRTPLFHAAVENRPEIVRFFIKRGASMETITNEKHIEPGSTLLMACAEKNSEECFETLMEEGADILATREDGADATYIAARYGHMNILERIAETKQFKSIVNRPTFKGRTALLTAAMHGHIQVCKLLFKKGANVNHQDDNKFTALIYAANEGHFDIVKWLIEVGANIRLKDNFGESALKCAENNGHVDILRYLKIYKEEIEAEEEDGVQGKSKRKDSKGKAKRSSLGNDRKKSIAPPKFAGVAEGKRMSR